MVTRLEIMFPIISLIGIWVLYLFFFLVSEVVVQRSILNHDSFHYHAFLLPTEEVNESLKMKQSHSL